MNKKMNKCVGEWMNNAWINMLDDAWCVHYVIAENTDIVSLNKKLTTDTGVWRKERVEGLWLWSRELSTKNKEINVQCGV